tara:strand:+ start:758 stop:1066 length:309 start_codon:yes stop_codon:yes gene_type:complete
MKKIFALILLLVQFYIVGTVLLFVGKTLADEPKISTAHSVKYIVSKMHDVHFHVTSFIADEIAETKEYQKVKWMESKEQMVNLNTKAKIQLKGFFNKFPESN